MPLTINLYREDEVAAALMFSIMRGTSVEAAFWCQELLDSNMADQLLLALRQVWLYGFGVKALGWLREFQAAGSEESIDPDELLRLTVNLCRSRKDRSILLILGSSAEPDRVSLGKTPVLDKFQRFVGLAILQRKTLTAWEGVKSMADPVPFLRTMAMAKHGVAGRQFLTVLEQDGMGRWETLAAAVAALCLSPAEFKESWEWIAEAVEVELPPPRALTIPAESLLWNTSRGETSEKEIMGRLEKPGALWGSVYWDEVAAAVGGWEAVRSNDEVREAFYDEHFPKDIPDEWSSTERAKSHGRGTGNTTPLRAFRAWFGRLPATVVWGHELKIGTDWGSMWADIKVPDVSHWDLRLTTQRQFVAPLTQ